MGTRERRARERIARRETILDAARAIFADRGLLASTIDEIAERAEVAKGTIYLYFKSKEEMLMALLEEAATLLAHRMTKATDLARPADENLRRIAEVYCRFAREEPQYFKLVALFCQSEIKAKVGGGAMAPGGTCLEGLASLIEKGIHEGTFAPSTDPWKAAAVGWASTNGILLLFEQHPEQGERLPVAVDDLLRESTELFIRGLKAGKV